MAKNISVPDIGDFKDVEIIEVLVKPGDEVKKNDPIVTLESDKSSVEVPSPFEGKISQLKVKIGDKVSEGSILATLEGGNEKKEEAISPIKEIDEPKWKLGAIEIYEDDGSEKVLDQYLKSVDRMIQSLNGQPIEFLQNNTLYLEKIRKEAANDENCIDGNS